LQHTSPLFGEIRDLFKPKSNVYFHVPANLTRRLRFSQIRNCRAQRVLNSGSSNIHSLYKRGLSAILKVRIFLLSQPPFLTQYWLERRSVCRYTPGSSQPAKAFNHHVQTASVIHLWPDTINLDLKVHVRLTNILGRS